MGIRCYWDLLGWQKAMDLVVQCYEFTEQFPKKELDGLTNQFQRAVVSVPANIVKRHGEDHLGDYLQYLSIAAGSVRNQSGDRNTQGTTGNAPGTRDFSSPQSGSGLSSTGNGREIGFMAPFCNS
jgi:hypothetical protein